jgi:hypothetical protein
MLQQVMEVPVRTLERLVSRNSRAPGSAMAGAGSSAAGALGASGSPHAHAGGPTGPLAAESSILVSPPRVAFTRSISVSAQQGAAPAGASPSHASAAAGAVGSDPLRSPTSVRCGVVLSSGLAARDPPSTVGNGTESKVLGRAWSSQGGPPALLTPTTITTSRSASAALAAAGHAPLASPASSNAGPGGSSVVLGIAQLQQQQQQQAAASVPGAAMP